MHKVQLNIFCRLQYHWKWMGDKFRICVQCACTIRQPTTRHGAGLGIHRLANTTDKTTNNRNSCKICLIIKNLVMDVYRNVALWLPYQFCFLPLWSPSAATEQKAVTDTDTNSFTLVTHSKRLNRSQMTHLVQIEIGSLTIRHMRWLKS